MLPSVDLCPPLLVGVLSEGEERGGRGGREGSHPVFLRVKQGLLLEVDMHRGQERARLELDCLGKVTTSEARWTEGVRTEGKGTRGDTHTKES